MNKTLRFVSITIVFALLASACGASDSKKLTSDLETVDAVGEKSSAAELGLTEPDADEFWKATGTQTEVADAISAKKTPDQRTNNPEGDQFLLYKGGTVWVTKAGETTAVVLYTNNTRAQSRHSTILTGLWLTRVRSYGGNSNNSGSNSGSSGNGFRGGGSSSGK